MPVIRTLSQLIESSVFYPIEFVPDIRTFHDGYKNIILENGYIYSCIIYAGYKNIPDIRTIIWKTVLVSTVYYMPVIRTLHAVPDDVLITGIHCIYIILDIFPTPVSVLSVSTLLIIVIIFSITILLILLVSLSVITALVIALVVLYRKTHQHTHTTTPTEATHPYEYIDMDKVVEHMSPARTADDTDYTPMSDPQYSNLK